jgi:two-component system, NarL family, invasion response regulator UvrY
MDILIVDDHDVIRQSLCMIVHSEFPQADCVKAANAEECIEILKERSFDLLVLDLNLPGTDGLTLTEWIRTRYPKQRILIFSMNPTNIYAKKLFELGVMGYLNKQADVAEIVKAFRTILVSNQQYVDEEFKSQLVGSIQQQTLTNPFEKLSKRELSIAQLLAHGDSFEEIAGKLSIEASTIRTYKARLFQKLDVTTLHDFLAKAKLYKFI